MVLSLRSRLALAALVAAVVLEPTLGARDGSGIEVQLQFADLLFQESRYAAAIEAYEQARTTATGPMRWRAELGLVRALIRTADFRRARVEAEQLAANDARNGQVLALYGDALWAAGLFDEAEQQYRHAATLIANEPRARNGLAKALAGRSLLEEALEEARAAVALDGREPEYHHTLGYVLERTRRYDEAAAAMRNYLNLLPNRTRSEKALWTAQHVRFLESFGRRQPLFVDEARAAQVHVVPFKLVRDKIVVRGRINGRAMDIVLDTGSEMTVVTEPVARRTGITPIVYTLTAGVGALGLRGLQVGRIDRFEVGTLRVENVPVLIKNPPLRGLPTQEAESFSPIALDFSMHIDYKLGRLTMARTLPQQDFDVELPLRLHRLALVRGQVNGDHPVHFVVDTGGEVISVSQATADELAMTPPRHIPLRVYGVSGWDPDAFLLPGVNLAFDRITMPNYPVVVLNLRAPSVLLGFEVGGIVGHRFLSRYDVGIDLKRSILGLQPS
jgi:Flp pilus assembly protein TadD